VPRSRRGFTHPSQRRKTSWSIGPEDIDGGTAASADELWSGGVTLNVPEVTIVRIRGLIRVYLNSAAALADGFEFACGIGLVTNEAFAGGATAIPSPLGDEDWDGWMFHSYGDVRSVSATFATGPNAFSAVFQIDIDSKSMRKWNDGMTLFGKTQWVESGTASTTMHAVSRVLLLLP